MKFFHALIIFLFIFNSASAQMGAGLIQDYKKKSRILIKKRLYYSALPYLLSYLELEDKVDENTKKDVFQLVLKTGTLAFETMSVEDLMRKNSIPLRYVAAVKLLRLDRYAQAQKILEGFPKTHRFSLEAYYSLGIIYNMNKDKRAIEALDQCKASADLLIDLAKNKKLIRYYNLVKEQCEIYKGRYYYTNKQFQEAEKLYDNIPKKSYLWPSTLLERAWTNYHLEDYNRSLGLLVTYKSPLLQSYYYPEASYLEALSFHKMCLWDDTLSVIDSYHKIYHPRSKMLAAILKKHKSSKDYFYRLTQSDVKKNEKINPFIRNLITQIRKSIKFNVDHVDILKAKRELRIIKKRKYGRVYQRELINQINWRIESLNHHIKKEMFSFINEVNKYSLELLKVRLEVISKRKHLEYSNKKLISSRSRGSFDNLNRKVTEQFYDFYGEFWADELGSYSFGLKSNCKLVDKRSQR